MKSEEKKFIHKWVVRGAKSILTAAIVWTVAFFTGIYNNVKDLQAYEKVQDIKIENIKSKQKSITDKVDDLHWYLIRRKDVDLNKKNQ
jgi:hypothetical protein